MIPAAVAAAYGQLGIELGDSGRTRVEEWARAHPPSEHGFHDFALADFGLDAAEVRGRFTPYLERFAAPGGRAAER